MNDEEKRSCKTCHFFRGHANYCSAHDSSQAEWDTCLNHETYDEFLDKMEIEKSTLKEYAIVVPDEVKDNVVSTMWNKHGDLIILYDPMQNIGDKA